MSNNLTKKEIESFILNTKKNFTQDKTTQKFINLFLDEVKNNEIKLEKISKCICGGKELDLIEETDRFGLAFNSLICKRCGTVNTSPRIKEESLEKYYKEFYHYLIYGTETLDNRISLFSIGQGNKIFLKTQKWLIHKNHLDVLELGCGTGSVLSEFKEESISHGIDSTLYGTEYNRECVQHCEKKGIIVISSNLNEVVISNKKFDLIILSHVFEHFIDLKQILKNLSKLLKEDALIYIEVPGILNIHNNPFYEFKFEKYLIHAHMYNFCLDSLKTILNQNNFSCVYGNEQVEAIFIKKDTLNIPYKGVKKIELYLNTLKDKKFYPEDKKQNSIKTRDKLFVYLDPGYISKLGHYKTFADKIHRYCKQNQIDIHHYVNKNVYHEDKQKFSLKPYFEQTSYIDQNKESLNLEVIRFKNEIKHIFQEIETLEKKYSKTTIFMYTCHALHLDILINIFNSFKFKNISLHLNLLQLNKEVILNKKDLFYKNLLNNINYSENIYLYMDSHRAIKKHQKYFQKKLEVLPIPLYHTKELKLNKNQKVIKDNSKLTISFFGYANEKYGFHLIMELYKYFKNTFNFIIRLNKKIHSLKFDTDIEILKKDSKIELVDSYIEDLHYLELIKKSDIIIIPYLQEFYPVQTSGVFIDALWNDKFIISTRNTWMSDIIYNTNSGLAFENNDIISLKSVVLIAKKILENQQVNKIKNNKKIIFTVDKMFKTLDKREKMDNNIAYAEKDLETILNKKKSYNEFKLFKEKINKEKSFNTDHLVYPEIEDMETLKEVLNKLSFALPNTNNIKVYIPINDKLFLEKEIISGATNNCTHFEFINKSNINEYIDNNIVLLQSLENLLSIDKYNIFKNASRIEIIDKDFFSDIEAETLRKLYYSTLSTEQKNSFYQLSKENFYNFKLKNIHKKQAFCFTTGPSFEEYESFDFPEDSLKIICNSIVKDSKFLAYIKNVDIITFGDPVFHFGSSEYAKQFRNDVLKLTQSTDAYILIPEINIPLIVYHYPNLKNRIIGLRTINDFSFPNEKKLHVKATSNILTLTMIPFATAIADTVFILGADGREKSEKYFWKHNNNVQYTDKMESVFKDHPSFFRDRVYEDYYQEHCETLEELIKYGELSGKLYFSITNSFIPALEKRKIDFTLPKEILLNKIEQLRYKNSIKIKEDTFISLEKENKDFTIRMNYINQYIQKIQESKAKIAIYGNGLIGKIVAKELQEQLIAIFDLNSSTSEFAKVYKPDQISEFEFDFLIITVLGREKGIIKNINVEKNKIITFDLRIKENKKINLAFIDKTSEEYHQKNILGPFTRKSGLSLDETNVIHNYFNKNKGTMIDVGAHFGSSSQQFVEDGWNVYCYEPDPNNRKILIDKLNNYKNVKISEKAISDEENKLVIFYSSEESTGISSLLNFNKNHKEVCKVQTSTLTKEIKENKLENIDFLKIDTEGYDLIVLKGFPWDTIKPLVIECEFEDNKTLKLGYSVMDIIEFLNNKGYHIYLSEWHPIERYGIKHQWKRFFKYENQTINQKSWGNIIAFLTPPKEEVLTKLITQQLSLGNFS